MNISLIMNSFSEIKFNNWTGALILSDPYQILIFS